MKKRVVELLLIAALIGSMADFSRGEIGPTPQPEEPKWMYVLEDIDSNGELDKLSFLTRDRYVFGAIHIGNDVPGHYTDDYVGLDRPRYTVTSRSGSTTLLDYDTEHIENEATLVSDTGGILTTEWTSGSIRLTRAMDLNLQRGLMNFTIKNIGSTVLESVTFTETHDFDDFQEVFTGDFDPAGQLIGTNDFITSGFPVFGMVYAPVPETLTVSVGGYTPSQATFELGDLDPGQSKSVQLSIVWSTSDDATTAREQVIDKMVAQKLQLRVKQVAIDIKPASCPNPLNVGIKGILPVAIVGTEDFDVTTVDPASVRLMGVAPLRSSLEDVATPFEPFLGKESEFDCTEEGPDGYLDLTLKFDTQEVIEALGEVDDGDVIVLSLTGNLLEEHGGTTIEGEDVVIILKKGKK